MLDQFMMGLAVALQPQILIYAFAGVLIGQLIGVLPGIGAITAISLLLPVTFHLDATTSIILLGGIYYGSQYGGSIASILLNLPGTPSSVVTCLEGYPLAQNNRAGLALFVAAGSSFVGGMIGVAILVLAAIPMASIAIRFGAPEYTMLVILGLVAASVIGTGSQLRSLAMVVVGVSLGLVGADTTTGFFRFVPFRELADGISLVSLAMGLFGVSEIIRSASMRTPPPKNLAIKMRDVIPNRGEAGSLVMPMLRGAGLGSFFGALPGTGAAIASFMAYALEKRVSRQPAAFGKGHLPGLAAPESANNAAAQTSFIPTLTLGIPGDAVMALILGALILNGIVPGPRLMVDQPQLFWGVVASFLVGNIILLLINIPLIRLWVLLLRIPYQKLYPVIIVMICVGVYSHRTSITDVMLTLAFGVLGYLMKSYRFDPAPLLLGFVLGPLLEENFRRAMLIYRGDFTIFVTRPISGVLVAATVALIGYAIVAGLRARRHPVRAAP